MPEDLLFSNAKVSACCSEDDVEFLESQLGGTRLTRTDIGITSLQHSYNKCLLCYHWFNGFEFIAEEGVDNLEKQAVSIDIKVVQRWTDLLDIKNLGRSVTCRCRRWDSIWTRFPNTFGHNFFELLAQGFLALRYQRQQRKHSLQVFNSAQ